MQKEYRILYKEPIPDKMLPGGEDGQRWLYPFSIVETQFIGKPEEKGKTINSELSVFFSRRALHRIGCWQRDNDRYTDYVDSIDCLRIIFEITRRMNKIQLQNHFIPTDPIPVEIDTINIEEWSNLKLDPSRIQNPEVAEDWMILQQKVGF